MSFQEFIEALLNLLSCQIDHNSSSKSRIQQFYHCHHTFKSLFPANEIFMSCFPCSKFSIKIVISTRKQFFLTKICCCQSKTSKCTFDFIQKHMKTRHKKIRQDLCKIFFSKKLHLPSKYLSQKQVVDLEAHQ